MFVIGLTGGIGTGKSTVAATLVRLGASHLNADHIGHRAYEPETSGYDRVVDAFGREIVLPDGAIDRRRLGSIVFADPAALERLNSIVHPIIGELVRAEIAALRSSGAPAVVLEAALLFEARWDRLSDSVWVTIAPPDVVEQRLADRGALTAEEVRLRVAAQMPNDQRAACADLVIDTNLPLDELEIAVERHYRAALQRAGPAS